MNMRLGSRGYCWLCYSLVLTACSSQPLPQPSWEQQVYEHLQQVDLERCIAQQRLSKAACQERHSESFAEYKARQALKQPARLDVTQLFRSQCQ